MNSLPTLLLRQADTCTDASPCIDADSLCFTDDSGAAECICSDAYAGAGCHVSVDFCADENFCGLGGVCTASLDDFRCDCGFDFSGPMCEVSVDDCAGVVCQGGGVCVDGIGESSHRRNIPKSYSL